MGKYLKLLSLVLLASLATACSLDELQIPSTDNPAEPTPQDGKAVGYLKLSGVVFNVDSEDTEVGTDSIESATRNGESEGSGAESGSNQSSEADGDYYIEVYGGPRHTQTTPFMAWSGTYTEAKALPNGIALEPGTYSVYAYQTRTKVPAEDISNNPYYAGSATDVDITSKQTTPVEVNCRLANIKTSVELSADLKEVFKVYNEGDANYANRLMTKVELRASDVEPISHIFERETTHDTPKYFRDLSPNSNAGNTMTITLTGEYYTGDRVDMINGNPNPEKWKEVKMVKTINGVRAAQWRKISIGIDYNTTGNVDFVITVQSFTYDDEIKVDIATIYSSLASITQEEEIVDDDVNDPLAPQISLDGQANMTFAINSSIYDSDAGGWKKYLKAKVTPQGESEVEQLYVVLRSTNNGDLLNKMKAKGFTDGRIDLFPALTSGANTYLNVAADGTTVTLKPGGMDALYKYSGTHVFRIYTKSDDGHLGFGDITVEVTEGPAVGGNGPRVIWFANGAEANEITLVTGTETVNVDITSDSGLTGLSVKIESPLLDSETLTGLGLATEMDILSPASPMMETRLRAFGFLPIKDYDPKNPEHDRAQMAALPDEYRIWSVDSEGKPIVDENDNYVRTGKECQLKNKENVGFSISEFISLLNVLGTGEYDSVDHKFTIIAADAKGTASGSFTITVNSQE